MTAPRDKSAGRTIYRAYRGVGDEFIEAEARLFPLVGESPEATRERARAILERMLAAAVIPEDESPRIYTFPQEIQHG